MEVVLFSPSGICTPAQKTLRILNVYNPPRAAASQATRFHLTDIFPAEAPATLVVGDHNLHHYALDLTRSVSDSFFSMANQRDYSLLNTPRIYTRFPLSGAGRLAVLDLAFASSSLTPFLVVWDTLYESTGSDHVPVLISFATSDLIPPHPTPDWTRVDWVATHTLPLGR